MWKPKRDRQAGSVGRGPGAAEARPYPAIVVGAGVGTLLRSASSTHMRTHTLETG